MSWLSLKHVKASADLRQELLLELIDSALVDVVARTRGLAFGEPSDDVLVFAEVQAQDFQRRNGGNERDIGHSQMLASSIGATCQECVEETHCVFQFLQVFRIGRSLGEKLWIVVVGQATVQRAQVEVQALVDNSTSFRAFRVQRIGLAIFLNQIRLDGPRFPQREPIVHQSGNGVLRIELRSTTKKMSDILCCRLR